MSIASRLLNLGVRQSDKVWGRLVQNLRNGAWLRGEFEEVEPFEVGEEFASDTREGSWFHFIRPLPDILPGDKLKDGASVWEVLTKWENHPYKPRAKVKVQIKLNKDT